MRKQATALERVWWGPRGGWDAERPDGWDGDLGAVLRALGPGQKCGDDVEERERRVWLGRPRTEGEREAPGNPKTAAAEDPASSWGRRGPDRGWAARLLAVACVGHSFGRRHRSLLCSQALCRAPGCSSEQDRTGPFVLERVVARPTLMKHSNDPVCPAVGDCEKQDGTASHTVNQ